MKNINNNYNLLSKSEKKCFHAFKELGLKILSMTLNDLSDYCCVSVATINRTINKLEFDNLKEYKMYVQDSLDLNNKTNFSNKKELILQEIINLDNYDSKTINIVTDLIRKAPQIYVIGFRFTSSIALELSLNLTKNGYNSLYISDPDMFALITENTNHQNELIIYVSFSGADIDMEKLSIEQEYLKKQVLITANPNSPVANCCNYILSSNTYNRDDGLNLRIPLNIYTTKLIINLQK